MTTTVTVEAHCDPKTSKVRIIKSDKKTLEVTGLIYIIDAAKWSGVVHGDKHISVDEVPVDEV